MKKKIVIIILGVLAVATLIGGGVVLRNNNVQKERERIQEEQKLKDDQKIKDEERQEKIEELEKRKDELTNKQIDLKAQEHAEFMKNAFSKRYYELENEIKIVSEELSSISLELTKLKQSSNEASSGFNDGVFNSSDDEIDSEFTSMTTFSVIFTIIFILAFGIIIFSMIMGAKRVSKVVDGSARKDMLNDLSDVAVKMAKELNPTYKEFKCPNCGASLNPDSADEKKCEYCGAKLYKTADMGSHSDKKHK